MKICEYCHRKCLFFYAFFSVHLDTSFSKYDHTMQYILTCPFNTTQIAKKELEILWYKATITSQSTLSFEWDETTIARVNINSRVGSKLYIVLGTWRADDFEELFTIVSSVNRSFYITTGQRILTSAISRQSKLTSTPAIQSITKKAIVQKLSGADRRAEDEEKQAIDILITIDRGVCFVLLNTTGEWLHQRWYRQHAGAAPLKENLAAALVLSSGWKFSTPFVDPFCGAGTIVIEAALFAKNIAPWLIRNKYVWYAFLWFDRFDKKLYDAELQLAEQKVMLDKEHTIIGYDIDPTMIDISKDNAKNAWVDAYIQFAQKDFLQSENNVYTKEKYTIITNPPYGERMKITESITLYRELVSVFENNTTINGWFISNAPDVIDLYDWHLWKETKYFNWPLECVFYKISRL